MKYLLIVACLTLTACGMPPVVFQSSCTVEKLQGGSVISCPDGTEVEVQDGVNGSNGLDGQDAIVSVIDPCGDAPNILDEVIFRLNNNSLMVYFESGSKRYLTLLEPGTYITTDNQKCVFTVDDNFQVTW